MPKRIKLKNLFANINGEKVPVPALKGTDADVTSAKIEEVLGYKPANEENAATKEDLSDLSDVKVGYSEVFNGQLLMYSDSTKEHLLATLDLPSGGVSNVLVNGVSVVTDGVANVPIAKSNVLGVAYYDSNRGVGINVDGSVYVSSATNDIIDNRISYWARNNRALTLGHIDYAVTCAMTDGKGAAWTAEEQAAACLRMGAARDDKWELIEEIILKEDKTSVTRSADPAGNPYNFKHFRLVLDCNGINFTGGSATLMVERVNRYGLYFEIPSLTAYGSSTFAIAELRSDFGKTKYEYHAGRNLPYNNLPSESGSYAGYRAAVMDVDWSNVVGFNLYNQTFKSGQKFKIYGVRA